MGGKIRAVGHGTIKLRVQEDEGSMCDLLIHNVLYVPECPVNLLSPQRWSQHSGDPHGTGEMTIGSTTLLFWNDRVSPS